MEIGGILRAEVPEAMTLLEEAFSADLSAWGADLARAGRALSFLLSMGGLPRRILGRLGVEFEVWVAREGGRVVGVLGQFGGPLPFLSGIAVAREARGRGIARALLRHAFSDLSRRGVPVVVGAVRADNPAALKLCTSVGMEPYGRIRIYSLSLPLALYLDSPERVTVRPARRKDVARLMSSRPGAEGLRRISRLNAAYAPWPLRLVGIRRFSLAAEIEGELVGFMAVQLARYWNGASIQAPLIVGEGRDVFPALLRAAATELSRRGVREGKLILPDDLWDFSSLVEEMGDGLVGEWVELVRHLDDGG